MSYDAHIIGYDVFDKNYNLVYVLFYKLQSYNAKVFTSILVFNLPFCVNVKDHRIYHILILLHPTNPNEFEFYNMSYLSILNLTIITMPTIFKITMAWFRFAIITITFCFNCQTRKNLTTRHDSVEQSH